MKTCSFFCSDKFKKILLVALAVFVIFLIPKIIKRVEINKEIRALQQKAYEDLAPKGDGKVYTLEELQQKAYEDLAPKGDGKVYTLEELQQKAYEDLAPKGDN